MFLERQVIYDWDDANEENKTNLYEDPWMVYGYIHPNLDDCGFRFRDITIGNSGQITEAILYCYIDYNPSATVTGNCYGVDEDNTPIWSNTNRPSQRPWTSTFINADVPGSWSGIWAIGQWVSIDVTDIIQSIVNRSGWVSGNALGIILESNPISTNHIFFRSHWSGWGDLKGARISITYEDTPTPDIEVGDTVLVIPNYMDIYNRAVIKGGDISVGDNVRLYSVDKSKVSIKDEFDIDKYIIYS